MNKTVLIMMLVLCVGRLNALLLQDARTKAESAFCILAGMGNLFLSNADASLIPEIGFKNGLTHNTDWGLKLWGVGIVYDYKWQFVGDRNSFFGMAASISAGATLLPFSYKISPAIILDIMPIPDFAVFISGSWTYSSLLPNSGMLFIPTAGFRLFNGRVWSIFVEAGVSKDYYSELSDVQLGFSVHYWLNP